MYDPKVGASDIYYAEVTDNTTSPVTVDYWRKAPGTSINVTKTAEYAVKVVDRNGGQTIKTTKVVTCNSPEIVTGMVPVIYDEENEVWKKVDDNNLGQWYDYAEKKWANIMLSDGLEIAQDGTITTMGSMFVWIPRYAYSITSGYGQGGANVRGTIDIKFLKETTSLTTDETTTRFSDVAGQGNWIIHPVFTDGSKNNYAEGGWDRELTGFWVAKFEASGLTNGNTGTAVGNASASSSTPVAPTTNTIIKVLPNVISWRHITVGESQYQCMQMCQNTDYGWAVGSTDTHLIKNDEWGAIAYLCYSPYGNVPMTNGCGIIKGSYYYNLYTGAGVCNNSSEDIYTFDSNHAYNTELGALASTTGNVYGVYDMAGGAWDFTAANLNNGNNNLNTYGKSSSNSSVVFFKNGVLKSKYAKYFNTYEVSVEEKNNIIVIDENESLTQIELYNANLNAEKYNSARLRITRETFNIMKLVRGIGVNETSGSFCYRGVDYNKQWDYFTDTEQPKIPTTTFGRAWDNDYVIVGHGLFLITKRGGGFKDNSGSGVLNCDITQGQGLSSNGFRPALVLNM